MCAWFVGIDRGELYSPLPEVVGRCLADGIVVRIGANVICPYDVRLVRWD